MMRFKTFFAALVWGMIAAPMLAGAVTLTDLRCENRNDPQGIDAAPPRLSWMLQSTNRSEMQMAWQILVASSPAKLAADHGDLWDSGKIVSDQSIQVAYAGRPLKSRDQCFWKVRVWDNHGETSGWSQPAVWSMGVLTAADWGTAQWIGDDDQERREYLAGTSWIWFPSAAPQRAAPAGTNYFRRVVTIPADRGEIERAVYQYAGDHQGRGWLDDSDLGARNGYHMVKFNDLTTRLEPGRTYVFGLTCVHREAGTSAGITGLLAIEFAHGPPLVIPTDASWKVSDHEIAGWHTTNFNDAGWVAAQVLGPVGMAPWGKIRTAESRVLPARYLRKEFSLQKSIARATVSFCGLGLSELYVNGQKIGDHVLSPAFAQYNRREYYVTHDVTKNLRAGSNALGVILGNGRFYADRSQVYTGTVNFGFPKLMLNMRVYFTDGTAREIVSDGSWEISTNGPITANNDYDGETYDARKEFPGWNRPGFDAAQWRPAQRVSPPGGVLSAAMQEPIRVTDTIKPVSMTELRPGVFIYDLGQNISGWCRLRVSGPRGAEVRLRFAETLKPDGSLDRANLRGARQTDTYLLKGGGEEIWEPRFTSHGFRYVELTGYPGRPALDAVEGRVVNDDLRPAGSFSCSDPLLNQIYRAMAWSVRGNYRSLPTDCPQRDERQGWLGDRLEEARGETYLFNNANLYAKWLQDIADAQRPNGSVPDLAPAYWPIYSDDVTWPSASLILPEMLRQQFGDTRALARHYDSMKRWMTRMNQFLHDGLIARDSYGDWCAPPENPAQIHDQTPGLATDKTLLATAFFYHDCRLMERYAALLGKTGDASGFKEQAEKIKAAFNEKFLDRQRGQYGNGTQTSCVLPLAFGLVPDDLRKQVFQCLVSNLETVTHGHVGTGLVGGQFLHRVLNDGGRPDLVYAIAAQKTYPSWGYMMANGATTIWELWNGNTADPSMSSRNHVMLIGDFISWLYENLAGIKPDPQQPAFKHVIMRPEPVSGLTFVSATHESPYGLIASEWRREGGRLVWHVAIPANTTATAYVPAAKLGDVQAGGLKSAGFENGRAIFELGSGSYQFISQ